MSYYEYWGLQKPPFDNVPDPTMYVDCHASMENAIAETLFAIEEGNECISVIVGDVGLGKTLSLRLIIDSLDHEKYKIALITNPDMSFIELLREIIGQLTGEQCQERRRINLLEIFNKLLFESIDKGKKILIFVDEANAISPANLESLRLLTNMQEDQNNLFTIVLAGQLELARRLEHPKRANLLQRVGTFNRIDRLENENLVKTYVESRLKLAGGARKIFNDDAFSLLWEYSDNGVPRLINKICKLSLKAGETNEFNEILGEVVRQIGERFQNLAGQAIQKRKPRKIPESKVLTEPVEEESGVAIGPKALSVEAFQDRRSLTEGQRSGKLDPEVKLDALPKIPSIEEAHKPSEEVKEAVVKPKEVEYASPVRPVEETKEEEVKQVKPIQAREVPLTKPVEEIKEAAVKPKQVEEKPLVKKEVVEELEINGVKITIDIPSQFIEQAKFSTPENCIKLAGAMAAKVLQKQPELTSSPSVDPVNVWGDIRDFILARIR
ncbi:MAG: AAA family ATPase [Pseudomonadota bacterium]